MGWNGGNDEDENEKGKGKGLDRWFSGSVFDLVVCSLAGSCCVMWLLDWLFSSSGGTIFRNDFDFDFSRVARENVLC